MTLVGWWPLHDSTATDYSGNDNHGTPNGGVTFGVAGRGGLQAASFDGADDWVDIPDSTVFDSDYLSISFWLSVSDTDSRVITTNTSNESDIYDAWVDSGGRLRVTVSVGGTRYRATSANAINDSTWRHCVIVYDGSSVQLHINGALDVENTNPSGVSDNPSDGFNIGAGKDGGQRFLDGEITDVRFYNRALSAAEIQTLYEWGSLDLARPPTDGVARYALDGDATDSWGSNDGTTNGGLVYSSDAIRGQSGDFDGTDDYIEIPISTSGSFSVSQWVKFDDLSSTYTFFGNETSAGDSGYTIEYGSNNSNIQFVKFGSNNVLATSSFSKVGNWVHVTAVYDDTSSEMNLYINGSLEATASASITHPSVSTKIGSKAQGSDYTNGHIDDVRIYDRELSPSEVHDLYQWGTFGRDMREMLVTA